MPPTSHDVRHQPGFQLQGFIEVVAVRARDGKVLRRIDVQNTITYAGIGAVLFLFSQDGVTLTDFQLASLRVGTNATPPTKGNTALGTQVFSKALGPSNRLRSLPTGELVLSTQLTTSEANGNTLTEAGLFLGNGQLFARQVHPAIAKTSSITVSYNWRIAVTA